MEVTRMFPAQIIDLFEDFLDEKDVRVPNEERDAEDEENAANIYGEDFDSLMCGIIEICGGYGITVSDCYDDTGKDTAEKTESRPG